VGVYLPQGDAATRDQCNETVRRIAAAMNAELATGRHDRLVVLE